MTDTDSTRIYDFCEQGAMVLLLAMLGMQVIYAVSASVGLM